MPDGHARLRLHLCGASFVLVAAIYLSTGTMAPYGVTVQYPAVLEPCHYLINVDHAHFQALSRMISGDDPSSWAWSVVLRRPLFAILAQPFVLAAGFLTGGVIASIVLNVIAMLVFASYVRQVVGPRGAITTAWLLATYPGITYWAGLPYSYVMIVPGALCCAMFLDRIATAETAGAVSRAAFGMGIVFLGYDLYPFFIPAAVFVLLAGRRSRWIPAFIAVVLLPLIGLTLYYELIGVPVVNSNSVMYLRIIFSYLHPAELQLWLRTLAELPKLLVSNFLFSNFVFLPLLFVVAMILARISATRVLSLADGALLLAGLALFLFNNAAPPYYGWQMRGEWIARLYQPIVPAFLFACARVAENIGGRWRTIWLPAVAITVLANASIAFGPILMNPLAARVYHDFYMHSPAESMLVNLRRFGRRPLGFCSTNHAWDNIPNPNTPLNRPQFMFRYPPR